MAVKWLVKTRPGRWQVKRLLILLGLLVLAAPFPAGANGLDDILAGVPGFGNGTYQPPPPTGGNKVLGEGDAARFLQQATFGPTPEAIAQLQKMGYRKWLRWQKSLPPTYTRERVEELVADYDEEDPPGQEPRVALWWDAVLYGPDQLRQRVAFALSEILVVSDRITALEDNPVGMAAYYDILVKHALGNYRELLEAVSKSPAMGLYLSHLQNQRAWPEKHIRPDENYAREILQLFSIGLWQLNPDGTRMLDADGRPIPTYDQDVVENFARVFTGWNYADADEWDYYPENPFFWRPMKPYQPQEWERLGGYHDRAAKRLLAYPDPDLPPDQWTRERIPALKKGEDAQTDLDRALDNIFGHPNVGPFLARRLIQRLVTSNPSPAYVRRVAAAFDDNGRGERGDLFAVVKAILLDPEARRDPAKAPPSFGKLREPIIRQAHLWRALDGRPDEGELVGDVYPEYNHGQAPLRAPSVFNFFRPDYAPPGEISRKGLVAPEFQILTDTYVTRDSNSVLYRLFSGYPGSPWKSDEDLVLHRMPELARLARKPKKLVDWLDRVFMARQMPDDMRGLLIQTLRKIPLDNDGLEGTHQKGMLRALVASYLVLSSPDYMVQK